MSNSVKFFISAIAGLLSSLLGILYIPVLLMVSCNVIDYITGLMAASNRNNKISSYKSMSGIKKKIGMWWLVIVGAIIDQLLKFTSNVLGHTWPVPFLIAAIVTLWIICNEIISILENLIDIGIKIPSFLLPLVKHIQNVAENTVKLETSTDTEETTNNESEEK